MTPEAFTHAILRNRNNRAILRRWHDLALPDAWLVAGCLFQTVWNLRTGRAPEAGIKDYDLFYFDGSDRSAEAEQAVQQRVHGLLGDLAIEVEVCNQARVHEWYPAHFGHAYPVLTSSADGIRRFLVRGTCVGVRPRHAASADDDLANQLEVEAPYGLHELHAGVLQPNALTPHAELFRAKTLAYQARWPWLQIAGATGTAPTEPIPHA